MRPLIYLATPYSHPDLGVRVRRYREACRVTGRLMNLGYHVFSPIAHSHAISLHINKPNFDFWMEYDFNMMSRCDELWVLDMEGSSESVGIRKEIEWWNKNGFISSEKIIRKRLRVVCESVVPAEVHIMAADGWNDTPHSCLNHAHWVLRILQEVRNGKEKKETGV